MTDTRFVNQEEKANTLVPVMVNINIKVPVHLKL